jgi:hypothetical protein
MKKIISIIALSSSLLSVTEAVATQEIEQPSKQHITLESHALSTFDGSSVGINAEVVHLIIFARKSINQQLFGIHNPDNSYTGMYTFNNKQYTIQQLVKIEDAATGSGNSADREGLQAILRAAKKDLLNKLHSFMENARNSKQLLLVLIEEDCTKRNLDDHSLLIKWGEADTAAQELAIFDEHIYSLRLFNRFCCDLLNFLGDLLASCPKGAEQFKHLCEKRTKAATLIPQLTGFQKIGLAKREKFKNEFAQYLFIHHLNKLNIADITPDTLETLLNEFEKKHK